MAHIAIEDFNKASHPNPMKFVDDEQFRRYEHSGGLTPYKVCVVDVCGFRFFFHSVLQLELCVDYYSRNIQPSSRIPYSQQGGGDHWEMQRWFDQLPLYLLEKSKRPQVLAALQRALPEYRESPGAITGTAKPGLWS